MGDSNNLRNFELLLERSNSKKPSVLYNNTKNTNKSTIKPQDVLDSVYSQIKTMQLADGRSSNIGHKDLSDVKSRFLAVNKLPVYNEVPKQTNTFETQCVSDTQLINIIEDAEALIDTHKGMTQEFDTDFTHTNNSVTFQDKTDIEIIKIQEFETTFTQTNSDKTVSFLLDGSEGDATHSPFKEKYQSQGQELEINVFNHENVDTLREICDKVIEENKYLIKNKPCTENNNGEDSSTHKTNSNRSDWIDDVGKGSEMIDYIEVGNSILNEVMDIDNIEEERSPSFKSPILKVKTKIKMPPLVVSLEAFERFEKIAIPLIDTNNDFDTCKHLINSQILGRELILNTDKDVMFNKNCQLSPIIQKSFEIHQDEAEQLMKTNNVTYIDNIKEVKEIKSDSLKDEILFSSDEENDFIYREFQDMRLTAALETSFYDHSNVLEETMYVGFQTASNKSIQICTNSFQKAQFILDVDDNINDKDFSLAELVEICDEKSINMTSTADLKVQENLNPKLNAVKTESAVNEDTDVTYMKLTEDLNRDEEIIIDSETKMPKAKDYDDTIKKPPEKQTFVGFKTASNKKIDLSDKALDVGRKVFKDIDFDEKGLINQNNLQPNKETEVMVKDNLITNPDKNENEHDIDGKINDDLIIQEFENIEMSLEEKEKSYENKTDYFLGFKTASNRNIDVSDAARAKIKEVFQDIDEIDEKSEELNVKDKKMQSAVKEKKDYPKVTFIGFKTANNKNIKISAQALAKTKNIFQDVDKDIDKPVRDLKINNQTQSFDCNYQPSTSKTANINDIKISEVVMSKSSKIFKDFDKTNPNDIENEVETPIMLFQGFKTASNKSVNISEQALVQSRKIFQDIDQINDKNTDLTRNCKDGESFGGKVVSKESIANTNKLCKDLNTDINQNSQDNQPIIDDFKDDNNTCIGFQTANNKPVTVSALALERSKKIFQEIEAIEINIAAESPKKRKGLQSDKEVAVTKDALDVSKKLFGEFTEDKSSFVGFKTASNKNVNVSKKALAKYKKIFNDLDDLTTETDVKKQISNASIGFKTANNNQVEISKEALEKSKCLFNDIEMPEVQEHTFKGFQTASKKKVEISKEALEKTKSLFNDIETTEIKEHAFKSFQTGLKRKVEVSNQALAKGKQIFQDDKHIINNITVDENEEKVPDKRIFSFQTANNQNSHVSEDAFNKSRMIDLNTTAKYFEDTCDKNRTYPLKGIKQDTTVNLDNIDTQVLNDFEKSLCTEDFNKTCIKSKRSGSPILSCPRAKKRKKFETPYKEVKDIVTKEIKAIESKTTCTTKIQFTENYKKNNIYKLKDLNFGNDKKTDIDKYNTNFNLDNILDFEFSVERNELTDAKMNITELKRIFISSVNKNLVPEGWLDNHLKLILWKLLSYEIILPNIVLCTVQNIVDQLKYRYDKELFNFERPVLRKIFEKDDVSTKTMVLCVAGIYVNGVSVSSVANATDVELLLTDGWYFIKATIDKMLLKLVYDGRIVVGCKIVTCGAELSNCDQGMSPWEDTSAVRLKMFGNSTRPAPWHAKLGYTRAAILSHLSAVKVDGGKISKMRVYVTRVYPMLYVEKFADGSTVTRSERLEHLQQIKYETERELMMERIYEEVQKEFSDQELQDSELLESGKRRYCDSGSQLAKMMKHSKDSTEFRAQLTSSQVQLLQDHTCRRRERLIQAIQDRAQDRLNSRNVVTLVRGRIATVNKYMEITKGMLTIWKPNDAILELFRESCWLEIMNTVPTAIRYSEIQISAGRQTVFRPTKNNNETKLQSLKRKCYKISDVTQYPTMTTDYNEIDTVGMVFLIEPSNEDFESNKNFQNVYLADADKSIISLSFWGGIKKFGFENILDTGQIVACANLQKRAGNTRKNIPQFRVTEFTHFTKTPKNVQASEMMDDLNKKLFGLDRRKFCDDCIKNKNNYTAIKCFNNENESPYRFNNSDYSFARNKMFMDTPQGVRPNKNEDMNLNLTGLDFESSFKQETQLSPNTMLRKKKVNEKIAKLKMYGEPPPLSPISIINKSVNAKNSYKSPLISVTSVAIPNSLPRNSVTTLNRLPDDSPQTRNTDRERSPVISVKKTVVRSIPAKLNFENENKNDLVDHFAEEFDGSPPLSLD